MKSERLIDVFTREMMLPRLWALKNTTGVFTYCERCRAPLLLQLQKTSIWICLLLCSVSRSAGDAFILLFRLLLLFC
jgi:hypothetical protein